MPVYVAAVAVDPCDCGYCDTDEAVLADYIRFILEGNARMASVRLQVTCTGQLMAGQPVRKWVDRYEIQYVASVLPVEPVMKALSGRWGCTIDHWFSETFVAIGDIRRGVWSSASMTAWSTAKKMSTDGVMLPARTGCRGISRIMAVK